MFLKQSEAKSRIAALESDLQGAEAELEKAGQVIAEKDQTIIERDQAIAEQTAKIAELEASFEAAEKSLEESEAKIVALNEEVEQERASVASKVSEELAAVGQPEPVVSNDESGEDAESIRNQFASMPAGKERSAFYQKHRSILNPL
jgi:chromosome segregation ATPase